MEQCPRRQRSDSLDGCFSTQEDGRLFSPFFGVACAFVATSLAVTRTMNAREDEFGEINKLRKKLEEAEAEVAEMKRRRSEDAKANEKVVAMFATQQQHWKAEKNKLKRQVEILLKKSEALRTGQQTRSSCSECARKDEALMDLEEKLRQMEGEIVETLNRMEFCKKECKIILDENKEVREKLSLQVLQLQKEIDEKEVVISSMLRKPEEQEELERVLMTAEAKKKQGDWMGLERSLHSARIKQRHLQEVDAFERQMKAKDERLEVFRWKLLCMENESEKLKSQNDNLVLSLRQAEEKSASLEALLNEKDCVLRSLKQTLISEAKSKNNSVIEESLQSDLLGKELEAAKTNKLKGKEDQVAIFKAEKDSEAEFEEEEYLLPVVEEKSFQAQMQHGELGKGKEGMLYHFMKGKPLPKKELADLIVAERRSDVKNTMGNFYADIGEAGDEVLQGENPQLKRLIEQATRPSKSCFRVSSLKGMLEVAEETSRKSAAYRVSQVFKREHNIWATQHCPYQELPTIVDKHVSETCTSDDDIERPAECEDVAPVNLHSGLTSFCDWQNGRSTASLGTESRVTMLGHNGHSKGKIVSRDSYCAYKNAEMSFDEAHCDKATQRQANEQNTIPAHTVPLRSFLARKNDLVSHDTSSYLKQILEGRDSSWKKDGEALAVSSGVKKLEQQLLQLEKMSKEEVSDRPKSKNGKPIIDINSKNGNENQQAQSNWTPISAIHLLKKQVKKYQALIEKIDDLCRRMHDKHPVETTTSAFHGRTREQTAAQELFLIEAFQLQQYVVVTGQKLMAIQSEITWNSSAINNKVADPAKPNMRQSIESAKSHLKEIQRSLEIRLARMIGDLEGMLARNGLLHVRC